MTEWRTYVLCHIPRLLLLRHNTQLILPIILAPGGLVETRNLRGPGVDAYWMLIPDKTEVVPPRAHTNLEGKFGRSGLGKELVKGLVAPLVGNSESGPVPVHGCSKLENRDEDSATTSKPASYNSSAHRERTSNSKITLNLLTTRRTWGDMGARNYTSPRAFGRLRQARGQYKYAAARYSPVERVFRMNRMQQKGRMRPEMDRLRPK
ncbi:hypothetical protein C8R43DRAFT_1108304 [Mycena crocata]|nr:hypothetical protein C8R43DRAFT_1108304 [Mycena crocata]